VALAERDFLIHSLQMVLAGICFLWEERKTMNRFLRRSLIGMLAGALASGVLVATLGHPLWSIFLGVLMGAGYSASLNPTRGAYVDNLMAGGALGVPLWGLISVIAIPLLSSRMPEWNAERMRSHFPALVGWVVYGAALGLLTQGLNDLAARAFGPEIVPKVPSAAKKKRIVILGGGFAGMRTAECLEQQLRMNAEVTLTLISETNALLFTPMLAEVAGSSLEPSHISAPLRSSLHRTEFIRGRAAQIDLEERRVFLCARSNSNPQRCDGKAPGKPEGSFQYVLGT
jgi:NADH:ubiquinone reductase (H+-translocating)